MEQTTKQVSSMHAAFSTLVDDGQTDGRVWRLELLRPVPVVVLDVDAEDLLKVPATTMSSQSRHSARTVRIQRSAEALALGACTGVTNTSAPSDASTSSNPLQNFASRSRTRKRSRRPCTSRISNRLRAAG
jgi:hypothetical protein